MIYLRSLLILLTVFLAGCFTPVENPPQEFTPVLMTRAQLDNSILWKEARQPVNPGQIYYKDGYIFINEKYKGIHVIDNQNPSAPVNIGFISVPGNIDMAVKGNSMYVDNAVDLVTLDLSSIPNIQVTSRVASTFPELIPPGWSYVPLDYQEKNRPSNTIIVEWIQK
jgi:hypothetical protein